MDQHTPGPWKSEPEPAEPAESPFGEEGQVLISGISSPAGWADVAEYAGCGSHQFATTPANLALILAAPDLLAALEACRPFVETNASIMSPLWRQADAAIAKARGAAPSSTETA